MIKFFRKLFSPKVEHRSATSTLKNPLAWLLGGHTKSGVTVNKNNILGDSAVWAAIRILSNAIASLPWEVYQEDTNGTRSRAKAHPVDYLINSEPHPLLSSFAFRQSLVFQMLTNTDAYVRIVRNPETAEPMRLDLLQSENVEPFESTDGSFYYMVRGIGVTGRRSVVQNVAPSDMIHLKYISRNGVMGIDIIRTHRENLGLSIASMQYGANFFGNGAHLSGVLESEQDWTPEATARYTAQFDNNYGGVDNTGRTVLLDNGIKYKQIGVKPSDAMLVEVRKYQVEEVARIFGIPAHMLMAMDKATFNNIEVMSLDFVKNTLRPICVMIEQEFNRKLFTDEEKRTGSLYTRFNLDSLLRGATKDRFDAYAIAIQNKFMNRNEVRGLENLNPTPDGDEFENPMIQVKEPQPQTVENE